MKIGDAFPSAFLKSEDLQGREVVVSIAAVTMEEIGQGRDKETKLMLAFHGKQKKMVLNKTNATTIAKLYGEDTDGWINQRITLTAREVEFQGDMVLALRVSLLPPGAPAQRPAPAPAHRPAPPVHQPPPPAPVHQPSDNDGGQPPIGDDVPF